MGDNRCQGNHKDSNKIDDVLGLDENNKNTSNRSSRSRDNLGDRSIGVYSEQIPLFYTETKRPNSAPAYGHRQRQEVLQNHPYQFAKGLSSTVEEPETTTHTDEETQNENTSTNTNVPRAYARQGKGLVLIINFMFSGDDNERTASEEDVGRLCMFFTKLKYDINCRSDMTKEELNSLLQDVRQQYLERDASKYYCFICVIMSHGNQRGICTNTDEITIDNIVDHFKNDRANQFIGKPKIFMVQACRGEINQQREKQTVQSDSRSADPILNLPRDADILVIYATTRGHACYRRTGTQTWNGAWFINSFLDAARSYLDQDIDRIMTAVRHDLSRNPQYEGQNQECQIAVSESTLTQLFYL